jgi:predicted amidohydrolase YtcJ
MRTLSPWISRIARAGASEEAQRLFPGSARTIDLHGATVLPGIIDAHTHLIIGFFSRVLLEGVS